MAGRLALEMGIPFLELIERMPAWELTFWHAFEKTEGPIGYKRDDLRAAFAGYMSQRIKDRSKPEDAWNLFDSFVWDLATAPVDKLTEAEINKPEKTKAEELTEKIYALFGRPGK